MWAQMNEYGWGGMGLGMGLGMLLFWGILIAALVLLIKFIVGRGAGGGSEHGKSALDLLKERYARGEIGREEFEQRKRDIEG